MIDSFNHKLKELDSVIRIKRAIDRESVEVVLKDDELLNMEYSSITPNKDYDQFLESFLKQYKKG